MKHLKLFEEFYNIGDSGVEIDSDLELVAKALGLDDPTDIYSVSEEQSSYEPIANEIQKTGKKVKDMGTEGATIELWDYKGIPVILMNSFGYGTINIGPNHISTFSEYEEDDYEEEGSYSDF